MGFEVFSKSSAPLPKVPSVTIQRRGLISISRSAHELIGSPEAVELLWDSDRQVMGLRPTTFDSPNAYPARPQSAKTGKGPIMVSGTLFTQYYKIDTSQSMRYMPSVEDGILVIDVGKPGQLVSSNRAQRGPDDETDGGDE